MWFCIDVTSEYFDICVRFLDLMNHLNCLSISEKNWSRKVNVIGEF